MFNDSPSIADIAAVTDGNRSNGWGDGNGWWVLVILFALFGWGGNRGGFGFGGGGGCDSACATVGDVERGFNNQSTQQRFNALDNAFAQIGYRELQNFNTVNNGICQLGYQLQGDINGLSSQISSCCCDTQRSIDGVNYNMSQGFCSVTNAISTAARDITENQNANYRALHDEIVANRMEDKNAQIQALQAQVQALNLAQSQANQNQYLVDQLRPCPQPAYITCNPWGANGYGGYGYGGCCGTGCN